eukprot:scaffold27889_cov67-Phaeocystis_antarctica.AAC.4
MRTTRPGSEPAHPPRARNHRARLPTDSSSRTASAAAEPYYSLNPGLFDSVEHWKYRDLQKLAKTLGISAGGKREDVVVRLQEYHRERRHSGQAGMFHSVEVKANDGGAAINPVLLSPLLNCKTTAGAPSPAKSARAVGKNWEMNSPRASAMPRTPKGLTPMGTPTRSPLCPRSNGSVLFSPVRNAPPPRHHPSPTPPLGTHCTHTAHPHSAGHHMIVQRGQDLTLTLSLTTPNPPYP